MTVGQMDQSFRNQVASGHAKHYGFRHDCQVGTSAARLSNTSQRHVSIIARRSIARFDMGTY